MHKYKDVGECNSKIVYKSWPFNTKYILQLGMFIVNVLLVFHFKADKNDDTPYLKSKDVVYAFFALVWLWSLYIQFFEYRKGIPHAWYCHQMFWTLSFISQSVILGLLLTKYKDFFHHDKYMEENKTQVLSCIVLMVIFSLVLSILGIIYKNEYAMQTTYLGNTDKKVTNDIHTS